MDRRNFIKGTAAGVAALVFSCSGLGYMAARSPEIDYFESKDMGVDTMDKKVLLAYASKAGSTGEVAQAIADVLGEKGVPVDVSLVEHVTNLTDYQGVILGSAIRMGALLPDTLKFVEKNRNTLSRIPTACFVVCATLRENTPEKVEEVDAYLDPLREMLQPCDTGLFAGKIDFSKLSFLDRTIARMVKAEEGDYRDWEAIRSWASTLRQTMTV